MGRLTRCDVGAPVVDDHPVFKDLRNHKNDLRWSRPRDADHAEAVRASEFYPASPTRRSRHALIASKTLTSGGRTTKTGQRHRPV